MSFYSQVTSWVSIQSQSSFNTLGFVCFGVKTKHLSISFHREDRNSESLFLTIKLSENKEPTIPWPLGFFQTSDYSSKHRQETIQGKHTPKWTGYKQSCNQVINGRDWTLLTSLITIWHFIRRVFYLEGFTVFCCLELFWEGQRQAFILERKWNHI